MWLKSEVASYITTSTLKVLVKICVCIMLLSNIVVNVRTTQCMMYLVFMSHSKEHTTNCSNTYIY